MKMAKGARGLAALLILAAAAGARAEQRYWITDLGTSMARGDYWSCKLNNVGQAACSVNGAAMLFTNAGPVVTVGRGGGSTVVDLNDFGELLGTDAVGPFLFDGTSYVDVAGMASVRDLSEAGYVAGSMVEPGDSAYTHAAIWHDGVVTAIYPQLRALGEVSSETRYVNNRGEAIGTWWDAAWTAHLFFVKGGLVQPLDPMNQFIDDEEPSLNDNGVVAGFVTDSTGRMTLSEWSVDLWWANNLINIGSTLWNGAQIERGRGFNAQNDISGNAMDYANAWHGYIFTYGDQAIREVASLGGSSCAHEINKHGDAVGHSWYPGDPQYLGQFDPGPQVLYSGGKVYDLNELIPAGSGFALSAYSGKINDLGQLLVDANDLTNGGSRAILLTPLPVSSIAVTGSYRADGFYTANPTVKVVTTDEATLVRDVHYRVDAGSWATFAGTIGPAATLTATVAPTLTANGVHRVSFYGVDRLGHVAVTRDATVAIDKGGLVITNRALADCTVGVRCSTTLTARGGSAPYRYALVANTGTLPAGLTLSQNGALSGTATAAGISWFQVQVTDAKGNTARSYFSEEVHQPLKITTPATAVAVGSSTGSNMVALTATGGAPPYTWTSAPLPSPLFLNHATVIQLDATPPPATTVKFTVTDAEGRSTSANITLRF
jgi:hypothetical protein